MRRWLLLGLSLLACSDSGPAPYGLADAPEQRFRFEAEESFDIDGTQVKSVRFADVILRAKPATSGETEVELYIDRYSSRTEGTPDGGSELSISEKGFWVQTAKTGRVGFGPDEKTLGGDTPLEMRARPVGVGEPRHERGRAGADLAEPAPDADRHRAARLAARRAAHARARRASAPGSRGGPCRRPGASTWASTCPLRWELDPDAPDLAARERLGDARVAFASPTVSKGGSRSTRAARPSCCPTAACATATFELRLDLQAADGTHVASRHRDPRELHELRGARSTRPQRSSDSANDREGIPQQGHLDDLPDHGGVRRGL